MNARRKLGLILLAAAAFALSGCNHNSYTWMTTVPESGPIRTVDQPIQANPANYR